MKIIQINSVRNIGSTGKIVTKIHEYLDEREIENVIIYGSREKETNYSYSIFSNWEGHLHSFLSRKLSLQGRVSFIATYKLIKYLNKQSNFILHLHNIHGNYLNYEILFKYIKKNNIPIIWTFHDCWPFTGKCTHYSASNCKKWMEECYDCPNLSTYPDSIYDGSKRDYLIKKELFSTVKKLNVVCNSEWLKKQVEHSFFKNKKIYRIYNGLDISVFKPNYNNNIYQKYSIDKNKFTIIGVSSVWKLQKGLMTFMELAKRMDNNFQIIMVGVEQNIKSMLPDNIIVVERTENMQELSVLYSISDVLLNASVEETFGMVTIEAMACGTPVIVSNTTACPEMVDDTIGIVVNMKKIEDIVRAIYTVKDKGKKHFSDSCIKVVREKCTIDLMCKQYYELYKKISVEM